MTKRQFSEYSRREFLRLCGAGVTATGGGLLLGTERVVSAQVPRAPSNVHIGSPRALASSDLTYLGMVRCPQDQGMTLADARFGFSYGALTGRTVGSDIHLFISGKEGSGWNSLVCELIYPGNPKTALAQAPACRISRFWGDIYHGKRLILRHPRQR